MSDTTIYLIRHGELDNPEKKFYGRVVDIGLDDLGREQIGKLGNMIALHDGGIDVLVTSPLRRARESAEILVERFGIPYEIDEELLETDSKGFEGMTLEEAASLDLSHLPEGMSVEEPEHIASRMVGAVRGLVEQYAGKRIGIVSHGSPIAYVMWKLLHSDAPVSSHLQEISSLDPKKGNAWRLAFGDAGRVIEYAHVSFDGRST
ncbi:MAG: histidine phosphatase family protein [Candidatus Levybacteria bacterium]|nr:histidine phosphatase family protein [Candidatus Levybacteria bacterium]